MSEADLSWVQALAEEHAHLGRLLKRLREFVADPVGPESVETLLQLIEEIATGVHAHIEFEEKGGYLAPVQQRRPTLYRAIEELRAEHITLQSDLAEFITRLQAGPEVEELQQEVFPRIEQWLADIRHHEHQENMLVQEAFNTDIGIGD